MISVNSGEMVGRQDFMKVEGTGSRMQVELFVPEMSLGTCETESGENCDRG